MKAVVTIFQFRRAVLPYLFMRYCYPAVKQAFPGSLDVWIIQDTGLAKYWHGDRPAGEGRFPSLAGG
jgi:hypothetical protein